jgi:hypothetical protein
VSQLRFGSKIRKRIYRKEPGAAKPQAKFGISRAKTQRRKQGLIVISTEGRNLSYSFRSG